MNPSSSSSTLPTLAEIVSRLVAIEQFLEQITNEGEDDYVEEEGEQE